MEAQSTERGAYAIRKSLITDDPYQCPECEDGHLVKIGIDLYRCSTCHETFEATETGE